MALLSEQRRLLNKKFEQLMRKFSLIEVKEKVLPLFDDLTWDTLVKVIKKYNLSSRKDDIAKVLVKYMKNFTIEDTRETYGNLLVIDLMLHHRNRTWTAVSMRVVDKIPDGECEKKIIKSFQNEAKMIDIYSEQTCDMTWFTVFIYRKTQKGNLLYQKPIFFVHPQNSDYIFFTPSPNRLNAETLKLILSGFGCESHKIMKLSGRNIHSLKIMLSRKKDAEKIRAETARALKSIENQPVCSSMGVDFCKYKTRLAHAKQMFGDESIELQTLTVNFDTEWRGVLTLPQAEGKPFGLTMRLKSKNVRNTLELMMRNGVIREPYPNWVKELFISGKNDIDMA